MAPRQKETWFLKIMGPALAVERNKKAFDAWVASFKKKSEAEEPSDTGN